MDHDRVMEFYRKYIHLFRDDRDSTASLEYPEKYSDVYEYLYAEGISCINGIDAVLIAHVPKEVFLGIFPEMCIHHEIHIYHEYVIRIFYMETPALSSQQLESKRMVCM